MEDRKRNSKPKPSETQSNGVPIQSVYLGNTNATIQLGKQLAIQWQQEVKSKSRQRVLLLSGGLGAGKTTLVQGIAKGLGIDEPITSPTFALAHHYSGFLQNKFTSMIHIDLYRLEEISSANELFMQEEEEGLKMESLIVVEWPERLSFIPEDSWRINIFFENSKNPLKGRQVKIIR